MKLFIILLLSLTCVFSKVNQNLLSQSDREILNDKDINNILNLLDNVKDDLFKKLKEHFEYYLDILLDKNKWKDIKGLSKSNLNALNKTCKDYFSNNILSDYDLFINKVYNFIAITPKQKNDLRTFKKCLKFDSKDEIILVNNLTDTKFEYLIIRFDQTNLNISDDSSFFPNSYMSGVCFPTNKSYCDEESLKLFFFAVNSYFNHYLVQIDELGYNISIFNEEEMKYQLKIKTLVYLIPFIFLLLHPILSFIGHLRKFDKFKIFQFFNLEENIKESFNIKLAITKYNNFKGITYINCLISISMIFMVFGNVFMKMINLPIISYTDFSLINLFNKFLYIIIFIGIRYSPRILLSCSSFTLTYKLISYLNNDKKFWKFLIYQIHKYIYLIVVVLFFYFSLYYLKFNITALWFYFNKTLISKFNIKQVHLFILPIYHFQIDRIENHLFENQNFFDYLWLPYNEIVLFIIVSLLIFICHKFNLRLDIITIIFFFILIISKFIYFNYYTNNLNPGLYYFYFNYGLYMTNPIFNLSFMFIGIFFGLVNYCIQNGLNIIDEKPNLNNENSNSNENKKTIYPEELEEKTYLKIPCYILYIIKKNKINIILHIIILIILFMPSFYYIFHFINKKKCNVFKVLYLKNMNELIKKIYYIDIEIFVLFIHLLIISYIKWINPINSFFNLDIWRFFSKIYFTFIVCLNLVIIYIFYHDNNRVSLNIETIFLFSIIHGITTIIISLLSYLFFELPYKKLIKNYVKEDESKKLDFSGSFDNENDDDYYESEDDN